MKYKRRDYHGYNMSREWDTKLFGCFSYLKPCLVAFCLPGGVCCLQSMAFNQLTGEGVALPYCLQAYVGSYGFAVNRKRIREELGIRGRFYNDCMTWECCGPCAAVQEYVEVRKRNIS